MPSIRIHWISVGTIDLVPDAELQGSLQVEKLGSYKTV